MFFLCVSTLDMKGPDLKQGLTDGANWTPALNRYFCIPEKYHY